MHEPLAFKVRPTTLDEIVGQEHLFNESGILRKMVENDQLFSMIFYGPPGSGKTTTAMVIASLLNRPYRNFNAVTGNKKELDGIYLEAKLSGGLVLIMDEVHRLNKDKQDTLLPHLEDGLITLIGATTANPLFAINPAIRSRAQKENDVVVAEDGTITGEPRDSKYILKEAYDMKETSANIGNIEDGGEWYEQADSFVEYIKGLTVAEVVAIELEAAVPTTEDLTSKVTIHVK